MREVGFVLFIGILLWKANFINGKTDETDASALRVMFGSFNSPPKLSKWRASGGDPCKEHWEGITCKGKRVTAIKLSGLGLTGSPGYMLSSLTALTIFDISNNNFGNVIPYQLPPKLQLLNLAGNGFTGSIPFSIFQITSLRYLNLGHNQLQGQLNDVFGTLSALSILDLSFNSLTGPLPGSFSSLSSLNSLYLQNNQFSGPINVLGNLPLDDLNVANNQFSGWIPEQLKNTNLKKDGGNSWSSGPAPPPPPGTPPANWGNKNKRSGGSNSSNSSKKSGIGAGGVVGIIISIIVVGAVVAFFIMKRRSRRTSADVEKRDDQPFVPLASQNVQELKSTQTASTIVPKSYEISASINLKPPPVERQKSFGSDDLSRKPPVTKKIRSSSIKAKSYSVADLQIATDSFSTEALIGEGSIGRVYRSHFDDGKVLAVKKLSSASFPSLLSEDFMEVVSDVSRLRHPNITELVGYCSEHGQKLLVYEFLDSGSLQDFLHLSDEYSKPLSWNHRIKIALGTARALEYLHEVCSPSVVHKNLSSANILLDTDLNPHLSDCGLASFVSDEDQALTHNVGSGYAAPEVSMSGQYTIKSDVYSFGVVMLELLSGRKPLDSSRPRAEQSLVRWATPQLHDIDALSKMVDPALDGLYPVKSLSRIADAIALCVQPEPEFRPAMSEVVQTLVVLVQRANMSKRTAGNEKGPSRVDAGDDYA